MLLANTEQVRVGLEHMSREPALPHIVQPLATLATYKGHAEILQLCVDKGVVFDRRLDAGIRAGTTHPAMLEVIWRANWQDIQNSQHTMNLLRQRIDAVQQLLDRATRWDTPCGLRPETLWQLARKQETKRLSTYLSRVWGN